MCFCSGNSSSKKQQSSTNNSDFLQLRLSDQEKETYEKLFNKYKIEINDQSDQNLGVLESSSSKVFGVERKKFPLLLGMIGTDIAEEFAYSIFDAVSNKKFITLNKIKVKTKSLFL